MKRKAEEGVKIYVVVYKEMAVALTINSTHTKLWLQDLHKNIVGKPITKRGLLFVLLNHLFSCATS